MLYSLDLNPGWTADQALASFWRDFEEEQDVDAQAVGFAEHLVRGTLEHLADLDRVIQAASKNWRPARRRVSPSAPGAITAPHCCSLKRAWLGSAPSRPWCQRSQNA